MDWLQVADIALGSGHFKARRDGLTKSTVSNQGGDGGYVWEARFPGNYSTVKVDGVPRPAHVRAESGTTYSYVTVRSVERVTSTDSAMWPYTSTGL